MSKHEVASQTESIDPDEKRNLLTLIAFHITLRCGWIFKVETVIVPAILDVLSGSGAVRGWLPVLNKTGQSLVPLFLSGVVSRQRLKSRVLVMTTAAMATVFGVLAVLWSSRQEVAPSLAVVIFLALYAIFFGATGTNVMAFNTVQGKLVRPRRRGLLLWMSGIIGSVLAITLAIVLMPGWLAIPNSEGFTWFFACSSLGFAGASLLASRLREQPSSVQPSVARPLPRLFALTRSNRDFRLAACVAALAVSGQLLFPHYQWIGQNLLGFERGDLVTWLVVQAGAVAIYSPISGILCDRFGTRLALRVVVGLSLVPPTLLLCLLFNRLDPAYFPAVFGTLGLAPVLQKTIFNYVLELVPESEHSIAVATMQVALITPFVLSPLAGTLLDGETQTDGGAKLLAAACVLTIAVGYVLSRRLVEPRRAIGDRDAVSSQR